MSNIYRLMQSEAEILVPGVDLSKLLRKRPASKISEEDRNKIRTLTTSNNLFLDAAFLCAYFGITIGQYNDIKNQTT